jgi:peptide chain release factor
MLLLQLSAAQGPAECTLAVARALALLQREALALKVDLEVLEAEAGPEPDTWRSLLLALDGAAAATLANHWSGTLLWICPSPYRPTHRRTNWFFGGHVFTPAELTAGDEVRFEAVRASGPGGQHVNKTASAVRATHVASGISVKVQTERSQQANRRLALALIRQRLAERAEAAAAGQRADRHQAHRSVDRGNAVRTFRGEAFTPDSA